MAQKLIKDLQAGDTLTAFFVLRKKELRTKKDGGEFYLLLELGDSSGRIWGTVWDRAQKIHDELEAGRVVKVRAKVVHFNDALHLTIEKVRQATDADSLDWASLMPTVQADPEQLYAQLLALVDSVQNPSLKALLDSFYRDGDFKRKFLNAPAGKLWHHSYVGGLAEHVLSVAEICEKVHGRYGPTRSSEGPEGPPDPEGLLDRDLLLAGALLHDIGKIAEYQTAGFIDFSDQGRLIGHIVIGSQMVSERIAQMQDFPDDLRLKLLHLILSHQGSREQGSPVPPMTLEAILLHHADQMDSEANALLRIIHREKKPGVRWSRFVRLLERFIYFGQ